MTFNRLLNTEKDTRGEILRTKLTAVLARLDTIDDFKESKLSLVTEFGRLLDLELC
jgi:hypothetical protein